MSALLSAFNFRRKRKKKRKDRDVEADLEEDEQFIDDGRNYSLILVPYELSWKPSTLQVIFRGVFSVQVDTTEDSQDKRDCHDRQKYIYKIRTGCQDNVKNTIAETIKIYIEYQNFPTNLMWLGNNIHFSKD